MKDSHWILRIPEAKGGPDQWVKLQPVVVDTIQKYLDVLGSIITLMERKKELREMQRILSREVKESVSVYIRRSNFILSVVLYGANRRKLKLGGRYQC